MRLKVIAKNTKKSIDSHQTPIFLFLVALFITCIIAANTIAVKIVSVFNLIVPAGVIIFPISYILGDVLTEVYGYKRTRLVIWLGFFSNLIFVISVYLAMKLPSAIFWNEQAAFERILGFTPRLLLASFCGYLAGSFSNSAVLSRVKILTKGRNLWIRTIGSTLIGEGVDSLLFISIAFADSLPYPVLKTMIMTQWLFKTGYEIVITPVTYAVVSYIKNKEKVDTFDFKVNYNPFSLTGRKT